MRIKVETGFGGEIIVSDLGTNDSPHVFTATEEFFQHLLILLERRYDDNSHTRYSGRLYGKVTIERKDRP